MFLTCIACFTQCSKGQSHRVPAATGEAAGIFSPDTLSLPMPRIPDSITDPGRRAGIFITHFWDALDFRDTLKSRSQDFLEQNFANFIAIFPIASDQARHIAVSRLMKRAAADSIAFNLIGDIADLYLYEPNSPYFSEENYIIFLRELVKNPVTDGSHRERYQWQLESAFKNRPGDIAADFTYTTREGRRNTLLKTAVKDKLLLLFYDPDCHTCKGTIETLRNDPNIAREVREGKLTVLAVDPGYNRELWEKQASEMPEEWTVAYEDGRIEEEELYVLRALPSLYLLDKDKKVLIKEVEPGGISN